MDSFYMDNYSLKQHIFIRKKWIGFFLKLTVKYSNPFEWWFDDFTKLFFQLLLEGKQEDLREIINSQGENIFFAVNETRSKAIQIVIGNKNYSKSYCYLDYWDKNEKNIPFVVYILSHKQSGFKTFESVFRKFLDAKNDELLKDFDNFLKNNFISVK